MCPRLLATAAPAPRRSASPSLPVTAAAPKGPRPLLHKSECWGFAPGWGHLRTQGRVSPSRSRAPKASGPLLTEGFSLKFKQWLSILHFPPENESQWTKWYLLLSAALIFFWYFSKNTCLKTNNMHRKEPGAARGEGHAARGTLPPPALAPWPRPEPPGQQHLSRPAHATLWSDGPGEGSRCQVESNNAEQSMTAPKYSKPAVQASGAGRGLRGPGLRLAPVEAAPARCGHPDPALGPRWLLCSPRPLRGP